MKRAAIFATAGLFSFMLYLAARSFASSAAVQPASDLSDREGCAAPAPDQPLVLYGSNPLVPICSDVHVEAAATSEERESLQRGYARAVRIVEDALGTLQGERPVVVFCKTRPCQEYFTGPTRRSWALAPGQQRAGATFRAGDRHTIVVNHVDSRASKVAAHEMVHIEFRFRKRGAATPAWFNEGVATHIAGEPDCSAAPPRGIEDLLQLQSHDQWNRYTDEPDRLLPTYCQARTEIEAWVERNEPNRLSTLLDAVRDGTPFTDAYGPMLTQ